MLKTGNLKSKINLFNNAILSITIFLTVISALILTGNGNLLKIVYPVFSVLLGLFLYNKYPNIYVGYVWWLWFLSPFIRRLADWQSQYTHPSPILLTPYLVVLIIVPNLLKKIPQLFLQKDYGLILVFLGILYGLIVSLIQSPVIPVAIKSLEWIVPVLLCFHFYINWRNFPKLFETTLQVFIWGILIMSLYGLIQYLIVPEWDKLWSINDGISSIGIPKPRQIRVWSTMNSPGPFATFMTAGLLLILLDNKIISRFASSIGYLVLLLSLVRTAWLAWLIGFIYLLVFMNYQQRNRLIIACLLLAIVLVPLTGLEQFSNTISSRMATFSDISNDGSAQGRLNIYSFISDSLTVIGKGFATEQSGVVSGDSGLLEVIVKLGFIGNLFYISGLFIMFINLFSIKKSNMLQHRINSIVVASLLQIFLVTAVYDVHGIITWSFLGLGLGCKKYNIRYSTNTYI